MKNTDKRFNLLMVQIKSPRTKIMFKVNIDTLLTSLLEKEKMSFDCILTECFPRCSYCIRTPIFILLF